MINNIIIIFKRLFKSIEFFFNKKAYYPIQIQSNISLIFIHINKNGGTSMSRAIGFKRKIHRSASKIKKIINDKEWDNSIKFTIIRNPFSRVVSQFNFHKKTGQLDKNISFHDWVVKTYKNRKIKYKFLRNLYIYKNQIEWISIENKIIVDDILRFESLDNDLKLFNEKYSLSLKLDHLNSTKKVDYKKYYNLTTKKIISHYFKDDLEYFKYEF
jgi:hypothetical protein